MLSPLASCRIVGSSFVIDDIGVLKTLSRLCVLGLTIRGSSSNLVKDILMQFRLDVWSSSA
jgi:hypothetical protein